MLDLCRFLATLIIMNWVNEVQRFHVIRIMQILEEVMMLNNFFGFIYFIHVYRERNQEAEKLSKKGTHFNLGKWYIEYYNIDATRGYYHRSFHENYEYGNSYLREETLLIMQLNVDDFTRFFGQIFGQSK